MGLACAIATPRLRRVTIWLLVPIASYYLGFINVILYNYDRFVLPMCFVLAIFGGLAGDRLLASGRAGGLGARGDSPVRSPIPCSTRAPSMC